MSGNKTIMAQNIRKYMNLNNTTATEICKSLGFKNNTFSDWINAKTYPRIDKIEMLANYFGINKADLIECNFDIKPTTKISDVISFSEESGKTVSELLNEDIQPEDYNSGNLRVFEVRKNAAIRRGDVPKNNSIDYPSIFAGTSKDISDILKNTEELLKQPGLMFDGEPADEESIESVISAMKIGMEMAKQKNKEKYTPKKYRKS